MIGECPDSLRVLSQGGFTGGCKVILFQRYVAAAYDGCRGAQTFKSAIEDVHTEWMCSDPQT